MVESAADHPRLAATFYTTGMGEVTTRVTGFLKSLTKRGDLSIKDPELAAEQLIAAWLGMNERRQILGVAGPPSADAIAKRVPYAVNTLVRARRIFMDGEVSGLDWIAARQLRRS